MMRIFRSLIFIGLLFSAACASLEPFLASLTPPAPVPTKTATSAPQAVPTQTIPVQAEMPLLRIWLPAQFDPSVVNSSASLLRNRFAEFGTQNADIKLDIRVKKNEGESNILESLSITDRAAPEAMPDLILLSRPELEEAVLKGLVHPIDGLSTSLESPDWYAYARDLASIQNTGYGLPFAGNALVLLNYPDLGTLLSWDDVLASKGNLIFPANNPEGWVALSLYASAGGKLVDVQGSPTLDVEVLTRVLSLIRDGVSKDVFPPSMANVSTDAQALQIYRSGSANKAVIWIFDYHPVEDGAITPLPGLSDAPFSYATGWVWALAGSKPENQQLAVKLAEFLVEGKFMGEWTSAAGYLPARPSIVDESDRTRVAILESAHAVPSSPVIAALGPLMQEAVTRVLNGEQPDDVAQSVVEKLK